MTTSTSDDPFLILGLPREASEADIRARYLDLVKQFPPDQAPDKFREIRAAFEAAKDPLVIARRLIEPPDPEQEPPSWEAAMEAQKQIPPNFTVSFLLSLGNRDPKAPADGCPDSEVDMPERNHDRHSMSDRSNHVSSSDSASFAEGLSKGEEPQFGVIEIVEAFTAMRHEWRGQTKESRQLAEQIQAAVATLGDLEAKLLDRVPEGVPANEDARKLAQLVAEIDHQLTRAVRFIEQAETKRRLRDGEEAIAVQRYFSSMSRLARWFARPLLEFLTEQRQRGDHAGESPAVAGLNLVLARLRRSMKELRIERFDTEGQPFDANVMNAIGTIESSEHPTGYVAEQFSPGYRWQGQILVFADVRVAN